MCKFVSCKNRNSNSITKIWKQIAFEIHFNSFRWLITFMFFMDFPFFSITLEFGIFDIIFNQCLNIPIMILYFHTLLFLFPKCFETSTSWTDDSYEEDKCVYLDKPGYFDECLLFVHLLCLYLFYLHCQQNMYVLYKKTTFNKHATYYLLIRYW